MTAVCNSSQSSSWQPNGAGVSKCLDAVLLTPFRAQPPVASLAAAHGKSY